MLGKLQGCPGEVHPLHGVGQDEALDDGYRVGAAVPTVAHQAPH